MGFFKFVFVILILVPVAIVMLFLINRLLNDFSESVSNEYKETPEEKAYRKGRKSDVYSRQQHSYDNEPSYYNNARFKRDDNVVRESTMKGNPSYEAYKKARLKQEEANQRKSAATNNKEPKKSRKVRKKRKKD